MSATSTPLIWKTAFWVGQSVSHLRVGGPVGKFLEPLSDFLIFQNIEGGEVYSLVSEKPDRRSTETALWGISCALHEEHDAAGRNQALEA